MGLLPKSKIEAAKRQKRAEKLARKRKVATRPVKVSFLIVCEGERTEPLYFKALITNEMSEIREVDIHGEGRGTVSLVKQAISIKNKSEKEFDRIWVVFDKDSFADFNDAIRLAAKNKIQCAWSNEAFELWYYLHFQYLDNGVSREQYIDMLEREFQRVLDSPDFRYEKKNPNIYLLLQKHGDESVAMRHAQRLRALYNCTNYASHKPCTMVDVLVEELKNPEKLLCGVADK